MILTKSLKNYSNFREENISTNRERGGGGRRRIPFSSPLSKKIRIRTHAYLYLKKRYFSIGFRKEIIGLQGSDKIHL